MKLKWENGVKERCCRYFQQVYQSKIKCLVYVSQRRKFMDSTKVFQLEVRRKVRGKHCEKGVTFLYKS